MHAVNDRREAFSGTLLATLSDLSGRPLKTKSWPVELPPATARRVAVFDVAKLLGGLPPAEAHLEAVLTDQSGRVASSASALFVPDRLAALADPGLETAVAVADGLATITLRARRSLARHVMIECRGLDLDVSDNFFDLPVGPPAQVTAPAPDGLTADQLAERLVVRCLNDVPRTSRLSAALIRARIQLKPVSLLSRLIFALQK
ncbi:MAG: hypothetical protein LBG60_14770 [Bifidobacteriaceae bacterium]|nr:hypothetical protein [Bifidobacteriaceae bacterium]